MRGSVGLVGQQLGGDGGGPVVPPWETVGNRESGLGDGLAASGGYKESSASESLMAIKVFMDAGYGPKIPVKTPQGSTATAGR